ncbi:MAG: DASS family sodium-coupled anion symporter [Chromatiales bacterium]|nr:DASS family sodium-coupled anion symporter [Chromatiales bacterium]MDH3930900.1 DASS family sodium-coupled anion symporter [Chromatiales bacterium]
MRFATLLAGPLLGLLVYELLPPRFIDGNGVETVFTREGRATAAVGAWMAIWWMTEAIPVYATALIPLAVFPLVGAAPIRAAAAPYGHDLIFLFMGGFIIALAMERWGLHRRIAFTALRVVGTGQTRVVAGFMIITAAMSMWVTNTATTLLMLPIAVSIITLGEGEIAVERAAGQHRFALCLLLGIAYAASIGGIGTLIGTVPNAFLAAFASSDLGVEISFVGWMAVGVPVVCILLPIVWWLLTRILFPLGRARIDAGPGVIDKAYSGLGPMNVGERVTLVVFLLTAGMWLTRPLLNKLEIGAATPLAGLSDAGIAIIGALLLFVFPVSLRRPLFAMDWETAVRLPWGLLVLFGGGLSLAAAIRVNGVGEFLVASTAGLTAMPGWVVVLAVVTLIVFLTELTSNTATTATLIPILAAVAPALGLEPLALAVPAAIAASCAFMLPVATPPNAIVFGSGRVRILEMSRAGFWLNLIAIVVVTAVGYALVIPALG